MQTLKHVKRFGTSEELTFYYEADTLSAKHDGKGGIEVAHFLRDDIASDRITQIRAGDRGYILNAHGQTIEHLLPHERTN